MYRNKSELLGLFDEERQKTLSTLELISPESLEHAIAPGFMTLGELALHLVLSIPAITKFLGFEYSEVPATGAKLGPKELVDFYRAISLECSGQITSRLDDESLFAEAFSVYSHSWSAAYTLSVLLRHEIHHRGQLSVLMRQAGLPLPDIYGPARRD